MRSSWTSSADRAAWRFLLATLALAGWAAAAEPAQKAPLTYAGQLVQDVLLALNRRGHAVVFSSDLVRPGLSFPREPAPGDDLARLQEGLASVGLALRPFVQSRTWLIVRAPPPEPTAQADDQAPAEGPAPMEEVLVTSSRHVLMRHDSLSRHSLSADELSALPELGDDALRAVNHLPGTASLGVSAQPHVRGGDRDETLVLFNQIELVEPFHLKGFESLFSSLNPALIERIEVYTGGFPARYGDRLSGVVDIQPVTRFPRLGAELGLSLLTSSATAYGSSDARQWAVSARRGNLDVLTRKVNPDLGTPKYWDWMGLVNLAPDDDSELNLGALLLDDDIRIRDLEGEAGESARSSYRNTYVWARYGRSFSATLTGDWRLSFSRIRHRRGGFSLDDAADESIGTVQDRRRFDLVSLTQSFSYARPSGTVFDFGLSVNHQSGTYDYQSQATLGDLSLLLGTANEIQRDIRRNVSGWSGGAYVSARRKAHRWQWEFGLRADGQAYGRSDWQVAPRLSAAFDLSERTVVTLAAGRFHQPEAAHELQVADGRSRFQATQAADHVIFGARHTFAHPAWTFGAEVFYKKIRNPKARYENLFNRLVLLPEIKPDRVLVQPDSATSKGLELSLSYNPHPDFRFWLSYTGSRARDMVGGRSRLRAWDQEHTLRSGLVWNHGPYSLSAVASWHSGWRTTKLPERFDDLRDRPFAQNEASLPDYYSLDLRFSREWHWPRQSLSVFAEVTNTTNRRNIGGYKYELEERESGGFDLVTDDRTLLPLVPSVGLVWKLH